MEKQKDQRLTLTNRRALTCTGVEKIASFRDTEVRLVTVEGVLTARGRELFVERLDPEKGEADITGRIDSLIYTGAGIQGGFVKKLLG